MPSSAHSWAYFGLSSMSTWHPCSRQISALDRCGPVSAYAFPKLMLRNVPGGKWRWIHARVGSSMASCLDVTTTKSWCSRRRLMEATAPGMGCRVLYRRVHAHIHICVFFFRQFVRSYTHVRFRIDISISGGARHGMTNVSGLLCINTLDSDVPVPY